MLCLCCVVLWVAIVHYTTSGQMSHEAMLEYEEDDEAPQDKRQTLDHHHPNANGATARVSRGANDADGVGSLDDNVAVVTAIESMNQ